MNQIIIAMSGRKGSGKNTASDYIAEWFYQNVGATRPGLGRKDVTFECSFADNLKQFCIDTLGLDHKQCYGTDEEKNTPTKYKWSDAPKFLQWKFGDTEAKNLVEVGKTQNELMEIYHAIEVFRGDPVYQEGYMTGREIMQLFGTDLIRQTFGNVWAEATIRSIKRAGKPMSIITDNRFPNEIESILSQPYGYIIRLTRSPYGTKDVHPSESALDGYNWNRDKCFILDNAKMNITQQNKATIPILKEIIKEF